MGTIFVDNLEPQSGTSLTLGASDDTLQAASGTTNLLSKIIQYKIIRAETQFDTSSNSLAEMDTNLRTTITPTNASNKIVIKFNCAWIDNYSAGVESVLTFYRSINGGSYSNISTDESNQADLFYNWSGDRFQIARAFTYIDADHNTTNSVIYTPYGRSTSGSQSRFGTSDRFSSMEVMEIAT
tara:strand:+ start:330 stop:878 length:549 start_codon:yes stop_codon:yes gene_type:complete